MKTGKKKKSRSYQTTVFYLIKLIKIDIFGL